MFISGGKEMQSTEGTTQREPVAIGMYTIAMSPFFHPNEPSNEMDERTELRPFANAFTGAGKLEELRLWWGSIVSHGPNIGYYRKASTSWLTPKVKYFDDMIKIF